MIDQNTWNPPYSLHLAGYGSIKSRDYRYDTSREVTTPHRLLAKYTRSGQGILYIKGKRHVLNPGDLFVIERPGPYIYCYEGNGTPWEFSYFSIISSIPGPMLPEKLQNSPVFPAGNTPEFLDLFNSIVKRRAAPSFQPDLNDSVYVCRFIINYIKLRETESRRHHPTVEKMRKYLENHFAEKIDLPELCSSLKYSQEALTRLFSAEYGIPPNRYLRKFRMRHAIKLLRESNLSIKEISQSCGFETQNYFCRIFRQSFGMNAGNYRRNPDIWLEEQSS